MKRVAKYILALSALLATAQAYSQPYSLRPLHGPDGGPVGEIAIAPTGETIVISSGIAMYRKNNNSRFETIDRDAVVLSATVDSNGNFFACVQGGVAPVRDGKIIYADTTRPFEFITATVVTLHSNVLASFINAYAAIYINKVWVWETLPGAVGSLISKGDTIIAMADNDLYYTLLEDFGTRKWKKMQPFGNSHVTCVEATPFGLIAGTASSGVYMTDRVDGEWRFISENAPDWQIIDIMYADGCIATAHANDVLVSSDLGATWQRSTGRLRTLRVNTIAAHDGVWYAGTQLGGMFTSIDQGGTWDEVNAGIVNVSVNDVIQYHDELWVSSSLNTIHKYSPITDTWIERNDGLRSNANIGKLLIADDTLYALEDRVGLYKWIPSSSSWVNVPLDFSISSFYWDMKLLDDTTLVVVSENVHVLNLNTGTFTRKKFGEFFVFDVDTRDGKIYVAQDSGVFVSSDRGVTWTRLLDDRAKKIIVLPNAMIADVTSGIYQMLKRSTDGGATWQQLFGDILFLREANGVLYGYDKGLVRSTDLGDSWQRLNDEFTNDLSNVLVANDGKIYLGYSNLGLVELVGPASVGDRKSQEGITISVSPNPLHSNSVISFSLPNATTYSLDVLNTAGQIVATIAHDKQASGEQRIQWNAKDLPRGVYLLRLTAAGSCSTQSISIW